MRSLGSCIGLLIWLQAMPLAQAAEPAPSNDPALLKRWPSIACGTTAVVQRIRAALDDETRMEFIETPLNQVVEFLEEQHGIPVQLDGRSLDDVGISTDVPVTCRIRGVTLRSGLRAILRDLVLDFAIVDEILLITVPKVVASQTELQVYNVADLVGDDADSEKLCLILLQALNGHLGGAGVPHAIMSGGFFSVPEAGLGGQPGGGFGEEGGYASGYGGFETPDAAPSGKPQPFPRPPVQIIPFQKLLIVRATGEGHRELAELLAGMALAMKLGRP